MVKTSNSWIWPSLPRVFHYHAKICIELAAKTTPIHRSLGARLGSVMYMSLTASRSRPLPASLGEEPMPTPIQAGDRTRFSGCGWVWGPQVHGQWGPLGTATLLPSWLPPSPQQGHIESSSCLKSFMLPALPPAEGSTPHLRRLAGRAGACWVVSIA